MGRVTFARGDYKRQVADAAELILRNRYYEENPSLNDDESALLARPGLNFWKTVGTGPIRGMHSEPGAFDGDLFVASGEDLFRVGNDGTVTFLTSGLFAPDSGVVNMAITQAIGTTVPAQLFFADGRNLWLYEDAYATANGVLTASGAGPANTNQIQVGDVYYQFTNASVDAGAPAGTLANPWLVALGASTAEALENLSNAMRATGTAGVSYSTALVPNTSVGSSQFTATTVVVTAPAPGVQGNSIVTTETGANIAWGAATMTGGLGGAVSVVVTPDDIGIFDVTTTKSYVICIPVQVGEFVGRFYWIAPGEKTLDPLDFATAESRPDAVLGVKAFGDQFWLPGEKTTEVWYVTGDPASPMLPLQGVVFDRGTWEGTAVAIKETLVVIDGDGGVFAIRGGSPQRISTPAIEEQIRKAITIQQNFF